MSRLIPVVVVAVENEILVDEKRHGPIDAMAHESAAACVLR
jgi:hypothetical protein